MTAQKRQEQEVSVGQLRKFNASGDAFIVLEVNGQWTTIIETPARQGELMLTDFVLFHSHAVQEAE